MSEQNPFQFTIDGEEHTWGGDCECYYLNDCHKCGSPHTHFQPIYGGFITKCDNCDREECERHRIGKE